MSNSRHIQRASALARTRSAIVIKQAERPVAADDYAYQQARAIKNLVRNYVRQHPGQVIDMLREDGRL